MLEIIVPASEQYNEATNEFIYTKETRLRLEHSLVSISKWESKWHKPFLSSGNKTNEEVTDYVKCMTLTQNVNPDIFRTLSPENYEQINEYINNSMTATTFHDEQKRASREVITSELIYYWMIALNIPMECQKWHLNRLLTLIRVCGIKNGDTKKMPKREVLSKNRALNEARRKMYGTKG